MLIVFWISGVRGDDGVEGEREIVGRFFLDDVVHLTAQGSSEFCRILN